MRPVWVPNLNHFYTGIRRASTIFLIILFSVVLFHPMRTLLGASFENTIYTGTKQASTTFITFFNIFLRGGGRLLSNFLPTIYDVLNRLQAVTNSHGSAKSVYKNGFRRVVGAALAKPNGARASRPQQARRLTGHAIIRSFSGLPMCCGQDGRASGFGQHALKMHPQGIVSLPAKSS